MKKILLIILLFLLINLDSTAVAGTANYSGSGPNNHQITEIPSGATNIVFTMTVTGGNYDLYTDPNNLPSSSVFDCSSKQTNNAINEVCGPFIAVPTNCFYYSFVEEVTSGGTWNLSVTWDDPLTPFGSNSWNVYGYDHSGYNFINQMNLVNVFYRGTYNDATLDITSSSVWSNLEAPSSHTSWSGCLMTIDNHLVVYKRKGFPCGIYEIDLDGHDDGVKCFIDGVQVYEFQGCCADRGVIYSGYLGSSSTVEFRVSEGGSLSYVEVDFDLITALPLSLSATPIAPTCFGGSDGSIELTGFNGIAGARVVKMIQNKNDFLNTNEIQVFESVTDINVASAANGGITSQSSNSTTAILLNDGSLTDAIGAYTSNGIGQWQKVSWPNAVTLDRIVIWNRLSCCQARIDDVTIEIYADDAETILLYSSDENANNAGCNNCSTGATSFTLDLTNSFDWSNSAITEDVSGLIAGTYDVVVTNPNGCVDSIIGITVTEPSDITLSSSVTNETCNALNNGAANLTYNSPRNSAEPSAFPGLTIWTKADAGVVKDLNGEVVQWQDLSGNDNHFNLTFGDNVQEVTGSIGGLKSIRFDAQNILSSENVLPSNYTVIVVAKMNAGTNARLISSNSTNWLLGWWSNRRDQFYSDGWISNPTSTTAITDPYIYTGSGDIAGDSYALYRNGTSVASNAGGSQAPGSINLGGGYYINKAERSNGDVSEVIAYNRVLTDDERMAIEKYLSDKYSIAGPIGVDPKYSWSPGGATTEDISSLDAGNYTVTVTDAAGCTKDEMVTIGSDEIAPTTALAGTDFYACKSNSTLSANVATSGIGEWSWTGPGAVSYESGTTLNDEDAEVSFSMSGSYTGTWTIKNTCNTQTTDALVIEVNKPDIVTTIATDAGTCNSINENDWIHIYGTNQNIIASVNDGMKDMGAVTVSVPSVGNASASSVCSGGNNAYLGRFFRFSSTNAWTGDITVRLYFTDSELNSLIAASHTTSTAPASDPNGCEDDDDVNTIADIVATKYITGSGPGGPGGEFLSQVGNGFSTDFAAHYVDFNVTSFSDIFLHGSESGVALPVEMVSFTAKPIENEFIQLDWTTATEINNEGFEIERSFDGTNFERINWVSGNGNSNKNIEYTLLDKNVKAGIVYYYRLKQIDFDGAFEYSRIINASLINLGQVELSSFIPNPSSDFTSLILESNKEIQLKVQVFDNIGRKMISKTQNIETGKNEINFDLSELSNGIYTARFVMDNKEFVRKLVVRK